MSDYLFQVNDRVSFKGDPERQVFTVDYVNQVEGELITYELHSSNPSESVIDYVPGRLLEKARLSFQELKDGDVFVDDEKDLLIVLEGRAWIIGGIDYELRYTRPVKVLGNIKPDKKDVPERFRR